MSERYEATTFVCHLAVRDPQTGRTVELEVRRCNESGALIGIDGSFIEAEIPVRNPYNEGFLEIPDDEDCI